jgi:DNA polymerase-3 subunit beta
LLDKLNLASRFTSDKLATSVALQGIYLQGEKDALHLYSTNLNLYYHTSIKTNISESFKLVIEPRKIIEFLQFLRPGNVIVDIKDKQISISQDKTKGNFAAIASDDFPIPPTLTEAPEKLESSFLTKNLPLVLFTASSDDSRPVLTGINFVASDEELLLVATDGFRLSVVKEKRKGVIPSMIIPADFLQEVLRNIKEEKEVLFSFSAEEKIVCFQLHEDSFYSRLIEGEFPPYERVIPAETKTTVKLEKDEFLRNIKLISVFARDFSNVVVSSFSPGELIMRPKKEGNEENKSVQEIDLTGDPQHVAFNFKYLLDFLNHISAKNITIEMLRSDAPVVFKIDNNPSFFHIIMPVRIQE